MALTRRKINSLYEEKETSAAKQEKLDRFRAGYLKDTSAALPETKNPPVKISAGGFTEQAGGDIRADLMQAADATRNAKSGNAASAALQGIGMYSKELPEKQEENKFLQNVGYIAEHIPEGIRAGIENVGTGLKSIVGAAGTALDRAVGQKEEGGLKLPTLKTGTKPTARTYSDTQKYGAEDYSSPVKAVTTSAATELMKNAEKYSKADEQEARLSAIKEKYSDADIGAVTQLLADITYSAGYTLPADVAGLLAGPAGTAVVMGTAAFGDALAEGMEKGYTRDNALQYALKETLNQAAMETLFDIAGGGIAEGKIMSAIDGIPNAVGRAAAKIGATGVGEGVEEVAQSIISTVNQKTSGDKEAEVDLSELGYEFLVGSLAGALRGAPVQAAQTIMESRSKPTESTSAQENTPIAVDNTTTETADVQTAKTEQNTPVSEDVAKTSEDVAKVGGEPIRLYRGFNKSQEPSEKNLTQKKSVYDVLDRTDPDAIEELAPLAYYTESKEDADHYASMDMNTLDMYRQIKKQEYRGRIIDGEDMGGVSEKEYADKHALEMFRILHGYEPNTGKTEAYDYTPNKVLDLTALGSTTKDTYAYKLLSDALGVSKEDLDDILTLGDFEGDEFPVFKLLRNEPHNNRGSKLVDLANKAGYDSFRYTEDGYNHYAIINSKSGDVNRLTVAMETDAVSDEENNVEEDIETFEETVDEDSPVAKSLRIAETDVYTAGNELVNAYGGDVRKAVDALYAEGNRLVRDGSAEARAKLSTVEAVRSDILSNNAKRVERNAEHLRKTLTQYGIKNVTVDMSLADKGVNGYYVPGSKTIAVSPKLSGQDAVNFVVAHELGHHAAAADSTLVNDIVGIESALVERGLIPEGRYAPARYMEVYAAEAQRHAASASGQAELKAHMDAGMTKEQAVQRIVEDYIHQEMASDILGELAKNPDILKRLKREERTLWQRIVDAVQDFLAKVSGKAETREQQKMLDTIRSILEDVSGETVERSGVQQVSADKDVRMSKDITQDDVSALRSVGRKSVNEFTSEDIAKSEKWARIYYSDIGDKSPFFRAWFGDWRENQTEPVVKANIPAYENSNESRKQNRGDITNTDTGWTVRISREGETNTISHSGENRMSEYGLAGIRELMKNAVLLDTEVHEHHSNNAKNDMIAFDHKFYALGVSENGDTGLYKITVEDYFQSKKEPSNKRFHNLKYIEKIADNVGGRTFGQDRSGGSTNDISTTEYSIADLFSFVKKYDAGFKPKPASEIRNEDGTPKVMYHGTKEQFTVFDKKKAKSSGLYGKGFYFTGSESHSGQYGDSMAVYLDIKRPLSPDTDTVTEDQIRTFLEAVAENEDYSIENYGTYDVDEILDGITSRDMFGVLQDINATAIGNFVEAVELFNEVNGTEYDGIVVPTETVAFRANQIKSATDNVGTFDSGNTDIRFSMELPVEESGELVAIHNLSESKLKKASELGGFAMPSIAIVRASDGHEEFGEISAVFGKDTIDPEFISKNKVYSGDAWTPTYPRVEYKVDEKVRKQVEKKIKSLVPYEIMSELGRVSLDSSNIEDTVNRFNGDMVEAYRNDSAMKYAYLKDTGSDISLPMKEAPLYQYGKLSNEAVRYFAGKLVNGLQTVELYQNMSSGEMLQDKELKEAVADAQNYDVLRTFEPGSDEYIAYEQKPVFRADEVAFRDINNILAACRKLFTTGVQKTVDSGAAKGIIDEQTEQSAYEAWLREQFAGIVEKEGIRNNVDYFTPSGNRRSFEALHWENTLENVVRAMKETGEKGIGNFGGGNIFGASTREFSSIDEVKKSKERLQNIPQEEYEEMKKEFQDRFYALASSLPKNSGSFSAAEDAANMLIEAVAKYKTKNGMANYIRRESQGWAKYSPEVVDELIDIVNDIRSMPTGYFEAKPQRAVGFDEVRAFIVPDNIQDDTRAVLEGIGKPVVEYIAGDKKSRVDALNSIPDIRFSKETRLAEENEYLKRQFVKRQGNEWAKAVEPKARRKYAAKLAGELKGVSASAIDAQLAKVWKVFEQPIRGGLDTMEVRYDEALKVAHEAAAELISGAKAANLNPLYEQYADLRKRLKDTAINPGSAKTDIPDYSDWRKESMGVLRLSDKGASVDGIWDELCGQYPEFFDASITDEAERIRVLADVANKLRAVPGNPMYVMDGVSPEDADTAIGEMETALAHSILSGYDLIAEETYAAKAEKERVRGENASAKAYAQSMRDAENAQSNLENERIRTENAAKQAQAEAEGAILRYTNEANGILAKANDAVIKAQNFEKKVWADFTREYNALQVSWRKANRAVETAQQKVIREKRKAEDARRRQELAAVRKNFMGNLTRIYNMTVDPTKNKHVPDEMREAVASLLEQFAGTRLPSGKTVDYNILVGIGEDAYANAEKESLGRMERIFGVVKQKNHSSDGGVTQNFIRDMENQIAMLRDMYSEINMRSADGTVMRPDAATTKNIEYLRQCNRILSMLDKYIRDMNVNFLAGKAVNAHEMAQSVVENLSKRKQESTDKFLSDVQYDFMTPETFLDRLGPIGREITKAYRRAQNRQAAYEQSFTDYMKTLTGGKYSTYDVGFNGKLAELVGNDGKILKVPKDQIMELYVLWNRPAAKRHIRNGGVYFLDEHGKEIDTRRMVFDSGIEKVFDTLTEEDKRICDGIVRFLSTRCADWGNEASLYLYGYRKFGDTKYFPMNVSKSHLPGNWDQMDDFARLENLGFTKKLGDSASAPLRLGGIFNTADSHVRAMAAYSAYSPINNDVTRMVDMAGMKGNIEKYLGKRGYSYLTDFIKAVEQNKVRSGDNIAIAKGFDKLGNAYKRAAVSWNISTAAKQPISMVRALNAIDGKYIAKAYADLMKHKDAVDAVGRMVDASGVAKMKVLGYSDVGFGKSLRQNYDDAYSPMGDRQKNMVLRNLAKAYEGFTDAGMWMAGKMDEATWARIWRACELETADKYKGLTFAEQTQKTAERFNEVIGQTQVVDTILDNAPILRSEKASLYTAFMSEPVKSLNSLIAAHDAMVEKRPGAKKQLGKAVGTFVVSNILLEPLVSIVFSMFRDDEDETDFETVTEKALNLWVGVPAGKDGNKWLESDDGKERVDELISGGMSKAKAEAKAKREYIWGDFGVDFISSQVFSALTGAIPYVNGLVDAVTNTILGYDNDRIDMANISKAVRSTMNLTKAYNGGGEPQKSLLNLWVTMLEDSAAIAGIPAKTFRRDLTAIYRTVLQATDSYNMQWELNKMLYNINSSTARTQKGFFDIMARAAKAGDTEAYKRMSNDLEEIIGSGSVGIKRSTITSQLEKRGYELEIGSDIWYIDLQAGFDLDTFNTGMQAERMITDLYRKTKESSLLPKSPSDSFTVSGETVKISDPLEYQAFAEEVGYFSYMILVNMASSDGYKNLTDAQKQYAIEKAYDYARRRSRKKLYSAYDMGENLFKELYEKNAAPSSVASGILGKAKEKK